jgi:hypothetical protein
MKILLTILCGVMILSAGGCVVMAGGQAGIITIVLSAIVVLNALMIAAMYGLAGPMRPAFMTLAVVDVLVAIAVMGLALSFSVNDAGIIPLAGLIAAGFLLKAGLSWAIQRRLGES